jgi:CheY-like chemotaxis protein
MSDYHILIVEDDIQLGQAFADVLAISGSKVALVTDGRSALTWLEGSKPDLIILDLHLPYVSGLEILDKIRTDERLKEMKVVVVTADAMRAQEADKQADLILLKPVSLEHLLQLV